jgi:hypothetical protein
MLNLNPAGIILVLVFSADKKFNFSQEMWQRYSKFRVTLFRSEGVVRIRVVFKTVVTGSLRPTEYFIVAFKRCSFQDAREVQIFSVSLRCLILRYADR